MAVQNLVEQSIVFISSDGQIDENAILANTLIQSFAQNSQGSDLVANFQNFLNWNGTQWTGNSLFELRGYISSTFQTTVQTNMPTLQQAFPQYTIETWGKNVAFGF